MYRFSWPVSTHIGIGALDNLGRIAPSKPGNRRAMICSAPDPWCSSLLARVQRLLYGAGYEIGVLYPEIEPDPCWETVERAAALCQDRDLDTIIAIGGGSTMDASKAIAMKARIENVVAIPTTAGTGSELNEWAVITNTRTRAKESIQAVRPTTAILDPNLTLSLPATSTLLTGIDAFCHALECYVGTTSNPITDAMAIKAMEMIAASLQTAVEIGQDIHARTAMLEASMLGGGCMLASGLGLMHGIGNIAGGLTHEPHGLVLARLLIPVLEFNESTIQPEKLDRIKPFTDTICWLAETKFEKLGIPEVSIDLGDLDFLAEQAKMNINSQTNPREHTKEDIISIVQKSFVITDMHGAGEKIG